MNILWSNIIYNDVPRPYGVFFQDPATLISQSIFDLHDYVMTYLVGILIAVSWLLVVIIRNFSVSKTNLSHKYLTHGSTLEIIWTITPALILLAIAYPSFILLYLTDEIIDPAMTVKVIASQWYWTYEYSDFNNTIGDSINFDSYVIPEDMLEEGDLRLLDVDNRLVIPVDTHVRFVVTAMDVIHNFFVQSLGVKIDCCPGRLNQTSALANRIGVFYGQCSEICGTLHSAMPISVEAVSLEIS